MRYSVVINDRLMQQAMRLANLETKSETLSESLKLFIRFKRQEAVKAWRGKLIWNEDLEKMRQD